MVSVRKRAYKVFVNGGAVGRFKRLTFDFGQTKGISLLLSRRSATVEMQLSSGKDEEAFGSPINPYYANALQKTMIAWLIVFGKTEQIECVSVSIDNNARVVVYDSEQGDAPPLIASIESSRRIAMAKAWSSARIASCVLSIPKSRASHGTAALAALAISKVKKANKCIVDQSERFMYLWMAVNGYYSQLRRFAEPYATKKVNKTLKSECGAIALCLRYHGLGDCMVDANDQGRFARLAVIALEGLESIYDDLLLEGESTLFGIERSLRNFEKPKDGNGPMYRPYETLTLAGYLTLCLPYYFRCRMFHADRPIPVFVQSGDERVWCLAVLSDLLERFLDENLWRLFDIDFVVSEMTPRLKGIVEAW